MIMTRDRLLLNDYLQSLNPRSECGDLGVLWEDELDPPGWYLTGEAPRQFGDVGDYLGDTVQSARNMLEYFVPRA